ncbi:glycosyltransferase family 87 protein [Kineosporia sp. NBRC 101731]|uniref:glycosyltransferase family 87 protein n=1 Tax=Kineosporia sp. NBRC 101731 TaxID=3032199 RepID=UPI0024A12150|nr:glycosyltransferase family 87 protein [Kineosporia sp. NBRC 101731]GLY29505.1 hypothetical protein Kisp02_28700 [Kineosporia sp. NBRC 101731]
MFAKIACRPSRSLRIPQQVKEFHRDRARVIALLVLVSTLIVALDRFVFHLVPRDFLTYRYAGQQAAAGHDIYQGDISGLDLTGQPFTYPPFAALVFRGLGFLNWQFSYFLWTVASLTGLGLVVYWLLSPLAHRRLEWSAGALVVASCTSVGFTNVADGQVNIALMTLCLLDLHLLRFCVDRNGTGRWIQNLSGVGVGLAAAIKITPALFIVHLAVSRQWRTLAVSLMSGGSATLAAYVFFPQLSTTFFSAVLWNLQDRVRMDHPLSFWGNASVTGALHAGGDWTTPVIPLVLLMIVAGALAGAAFAHRRGHPLNAILIIGLVAPIISPYAWVHHYIYLVPAGTIILRPLLLHPPHPDLSNRLRRAGAVWCLLALGPGSGHWLLQHGGEWLLPLALIIREGPILASLLCITLLVRDAQTRSPVATPTTTSFIGRFS